MSNTIIGLDFGTHSIKLVRLLPGREPRILELDREPLPQISEEVEPVDRWGEPDGAHGPDAHDDEAAHGEPGAAQAEPDGAPGSEQGPVPNEAPEAADGEPSDQVEPEPDAPWEIALDRLIERGAFDDDGLVVTFLPDGQAMSVREKVPFAERDKVENILPHMLDERLPVEVHEVVYDFQLLKTPVEEGAEAVIGFARREEIGAFLSSLKDHRIDPAILGIPEMLLSFALERCAPTDEGTFAVVDVGHRFTRLLVLHEREPVAARSLKFGGHHLTEAIAKRFDATYEQAENLKEHHGRLLGPEAASPTEDQRALDACLTEALGPLMRELRRTFQSLYARSRVEVDEIFLCGGTSRLEGFSEHLRRDLGVEVSPLRIDDLGGLDSPSTDAKGEPEYALATATALQQVDAREGAHVIDLRKDEFTYRGKASFLRKQLFKYGAAVGVVFLLVFAMLFTQKMELEAQRDAMHQALGESTKELFGSSVYTSDEITSRLTGEQNSKRSFVPKMSAYQLYYELTSRVPEDMDVELNRFEVDIDRNIAQIYGEATDAEAVGRLEDELSELDCLEEVRQEGDLTIRNDSEVDFHLHVSSNCS